ncbi:TatD family hydrolase [Methanobrevibacter filiformis]|uniref:Putative deoxyribonuclease YcfH n=1 Tax=Methanobrevibacter filiformis TaxID=55758 RepID=A0A162FI93_9EURY|nr:TatD family hydrolase [Methanobrevibacter filiformis]KZX10380.1 putative deoxyribonuclease YcfH [Methanobrevibacter filiformis]
MIDIHCHLDFEEYDNDRHEVIKRAKDKLRAVINSGTSYEGNKRVFELSNNNKGFIYPTFGFHPTNSGKSSELDIEIAINHMIEYMDDIVAIGEVGMDYFYIKDKKEREKQIEIFKQFATLANDYKKPIVIHCRDAEKKAFNLIQEFDDIPSVIFHCYSGSLKTANKLVDNGYFMSFSNMLSYSKQHQDLVKEIPLDNILTETDSPYLSTIRGERNEPYNVYKTLNKIAELKNIDLNLVNEITETNAIEVFNI